MTLHATINALAAEFAHELLRAIRNSSLDEIIAETHGGHTRQARAAGRPRALGAKTGGRLARRSDADLKRLADKIIALVAANKNGINAEGIKSALKIERKELPRPLAMALKSKKISKRGKKRATKYFKG